MSRIAIDNTWAASDNSKIGYLSGGGLIITYYNILGFWIESPKKSMWIS